MAWGAGMGASGALVVTATTMFMYWVFSTLGPIDNFKEATVISDLVFLLSIVVGGLIWIAFVPMPASRIGISPLGVVFKSAFRLTIVPWSRVMLVANTLVILTPKTRVARSLSLDQYQVSRVALFVARTI
jgi:hypothetical protein